MVLIVADPLHAQFTYTDLYDFNCATSAGGCHPFDWGELTQGADGNLYGTASIGGAFQRGTIFKATPGGAYTDFFDFSSADVTGELPISALTLATDGNFYGVASLGTLFGPEVYRVTPSGSLTVLHNFDFAPPFPDLFLVGVPPVEASDSSGNSFLYGLTSEGATYRITLPAGTFQQLSNNAPGQSFGPLLPAYGALYGTTADGGKYGNGTIFRMTTEGAISIVYSFTGGSDGSIPEAALTLGADGNLYGTTAYGGANGAGEVFKLKLSPPICSLCGAVLTVLHSFEAFSSTLSPLCNNDGGEPAAGLLAATDGHFYGTTTAGGANCIGTIFSVTAGGIFFKIFDFQECSMCGNPILGQFPFSALVEHTNGLFYGLTAVGGVIPTLGPSGGNLYRLSPASSRFTVKVAGPIWVHPGEPVQFLGNNLEGALNVSFGPLSAQFHVGSNTFLVAQVPSAAIDGLVTVTLATGEQIESQATMHILPIITNLDPSAGTVGTQVGIVGGGLTGAIEATFGGVRATNFNVVTPNLIQAIVPTGARTGKVRVITPNGVAASKTTFTVN